MVLKRGKFAFCYNTEQKPDLEFVAESRAKKPEEHQNFPWRCVPGSLATLSPQSELPLTTCP